MRSTEYPLQLEPFDDQSDELHPPAVYPWVKPHLARRLELDRAQRAVPGLTVQANAGALYGAFCGAGLRIDLGEVLGTVLAQDALWPLHWMYGGARSRDFCVGDKAGVWARPGDIVITRPGEFHRPDCPEVPEALRGRKFTLNGGTRVRVNKVMLCKGEVLYEVAGWVYPASAFEVENFAEW